MLECKKDNGVGSTEIAEGGDERRKGGLRIEQVWTRAQCQKGANSSRHLQAASCYSEIFTCTSNEIWLLFAQHTNVMPPGVLHHLQTQATASTFESSQESSQAIFPF